MTGAALSHEDVIVTNQDVRVDDPGALGADAAGQFIKNIVRVFFEIGRGGQRAHGRLGRHGLIQFKSFHSVMSALGHGRQRHDIRSYR
jgi:hypothetical protein